MVLGRTRPRRMINLLSPIYFHSFMIVTLKLKPGLRDVQQHKNIYEN